MWLSAFRILNFSPVSRVTLLPSKGSASWMPSFVNSQLSMETLLQRFMDKIWVSTENLCGKRSQGSRKPRAEGTEERNRNLSQVWQQLRNNILLLSAFRYLCNHIVLWWLLHSHIHHGTQSSKQVSPAVSYPDPGCLAIASCCLFKTSYSKLLFI